MTDYGLNLHDLVYWAEKLRVFSLNLPATIGIW